MKTAVVLICLVTLLFAQPPSQHPVISETFYSIFRAELVSRNDSGRVHFEGIYARDFQAMKELSNLTYVMKGMPVLHDWSLGRYDINKTFEISWDGDGPRGACYEEPPIEDFIPIWAWVKYAKYNDTEEYDNHKIDIYVYKENGIEVSLGVIREDPNTPYIFRQITLNYYLVFYYDNFKPFVPDTSIFDIPGGCQAALLNKPLRHKLFKLNKSYLLTSVLSNFH